MNTSATISKLAPALVKAKKAFAPAVKSAVNPQFKSKYVDLATAIEAAEPALLENGIVVLQGVQGNIDTQSISVNTRILHESGEWIEDTLTLPAVGRGGEFTAQTSGSATTYARRYSYMAILGFAPEDDDGNEASKTNGNGHAPSVKIITSQQAAEFREACKQNGKAGDVVSKALNSKGINNSASIPATQFHGWMEWARNENEVPA